MAEQQSQGHIEGGVRCEGCGYALDGLASDGVCSECGLAVRMSQPRDRAGTPWQRRAGVRSLVRTWWSLAWDDDCWREMRISRSSRRAYIGWARVLAYSVLLLAAVWFVLIEMAGRISSSALTYLVLVMVIPMFVVEFAMFVYRAMIGWRLTIGTKLRDEGQERAAHEQVLDHACAGMMITPVFLALGLASVNIGMHIEQATGAFVALRVAFFVGAGLSVLGLVAGLLIFELSYRRGWRVMRYRRLIGSEYGQVNVDDEFDAVFDGLGLLRISSWREQWRRQPVGVINFVGGLMVKLVIVPGVILFVWLVLGLPIPTALLLALLLYGVLSIFQRMLMVPVRVALRRGASR